MSAERITVQVEVDTDDLRTWANWHADRGHHGAAHVLYKAAADGEALTDQALREARAQAVREAKDDIRARIVTFRSLGADDQYLNALNDAWGLVANRERQHHTPASTQGVTE